MTEMYINIPTKYDVFYIKSLIWRWTLDDELFINQEDKCRVCGGDGSACETTSNVIKDQDMTMGYNDLVMIPPGSTNIRIAEVKIS